MIINTFKTPIDASLFNFKWSFAQEITVTYGTSCDNGKVTVMVTEIALSPALLMELNNKHELKKQIEAAAMHNAQTYWQEQNKSAIDLSNINPAFHGAFAGII